MGRPDMSPVNALDIRKKLAAECEEAKRHYYKKVGFSGFIRENVLGRGAVNFDEKYDPNDEDEEKHYRADCYVSFYMDMHLKQNLETLRYCFKDDIPQPLFFVDFGCCPMTSGLALAEVLGKQTKTIHRPHPNTKHIKTTYKQQTTYLGIDTSENMVNKAHKINREYNLFEQSHFVIKQGKGLDLLNRLHISPDIKTAVLVLSFVLAPRTCNLEEQEIKELAYKWKAYLDNNHDYRKTHIIYINPAYDRLNHNWSDVFRPAMLEENHTGDFTYNEKELTQLDVLPKPITLGIITGERS